MTSCIAQTVKNLPAMQETGVQSLDWEDPLGKGMATHSSILDWRNPWTEEPPGYSPWVRNESDMTEQLTFPGGSSGKEPICRCRRCKRRRFHPWVRKITWRRVWQATPVFLPGESHGQRSLEGYSPWGHEVSNTTEVT